LDGSGDIPSLSTQHSTSSIPSQSGGFSFDDFDAPETNVKVTGDDEIEKFENEFPELDAGPVRAFVFSAVQGVRHIKHQI
jgi:hypothetical protein